MSKAGFFVWKEGETAFFPGEESRFYFQIIREKC